MERCAQGQGHIQTCIGYCVVSEQDLAGVEAWMDATAFTAEELLDELQEEHAPPVVGDILVVFYF